MCIRDRAQYVGPINDHFNPKDPDYDTINDPEEFRFHQAYLAYSGYDSTAQFGSQETLLRILAHLAKLPAAKRQEVIFGPYPSGGATIVVTDSEGRVHRGRTR